MPDKDLDERKARYETVFNMIDVPSGVSIVGYRVSAVEFQRVHDEIRRQREAEAKAGLAVIFGGDDA